MSNSGSAYGSFYSKDQESAILSVSSSDYSQFNSVQAKYQQLRDNRHSNPVPQSYSSFGTGSGQSSGSTFDLHNQYKRKSHSPVGSTPYYRPHTEHNSYDIPIPASLLKPPLISQDNASNSAPSSSSGNSLFSGAGSAAQNANRTKHTSLVPPARSRHEKTHSMSAIDTLQSYNIQTGNINATALLDFDDLENLSVETSRKSDVSDIDKGKKHKFRFWKRSPKKTKKEKSFELTSPVKKSSVDLSNASFDAASSVNTHTYNVSIDDVPIVETKSLIKRTSVDLDSIGEEEDPDSPLLKDLTIGSVTPSAHELMMQPLNVSKPKPQRRPVPEPPKHAQRNDSVSTSDTASTVFQNSIHSDRYRQIIKENLMNSPKEKDQSYTVRDRRYIDFTAESRSLQMGPSPVRTDFSESTYARDSSSIRLVQQQSTPFDPYEYGAYTEDADKTIGIVSETSSSSSSINPDAIYSPINDTITSSDYKNSFDSENNRTIEPITLMSNEILESSAQNEQVSYSAPADPMAEYESLAILRYYELNSSTSTFRTESRNVSYASCERTPVLKVVNGSANSSTRSSISTASSHTTVGTVHSENIGAPKDLSLDNRVFSFADSIASESQFNQNVAVQNEIKSNAFEETNYEREKYNSNNRNTSIIYYTERDLVANPIRNSTLSSAKSNGSSWESVSSNGSTLISAVNSLYKEYIHRKGYDNIQELCDQNSVSIPDAIRQLKLESELEKMIYN